MDASQLAAAMLRLQAAGCHNINFVTPEHVVPQVLEALPIAIPGGLRLPLVYNTGAYDSLETIRLMDGVVDVYMPDFKLWDPQLCAKYLRAGDYAEAARRVIKAMHDQVGELSVDEDGLALRDTFCPPLAGDRGVARYLRESDGPVPSRAQSRDGAPIL